MVRRKIVNVGMREEGIFKLNRYMCSMRGDKFLFEKCICIIEI